MYIQNNICKFQWTFSSYPDIYQVSASWVTYFSICSTQIYLFAKYVLQKYVYSFIKVCNKNTLYLLKLIPYHEMFTVKVWIDIYWLKKYYSSLNFTRIIEMIQHLFLILININILSLPSKIVIISWFSSCKVSF